MSCTNPAHTHDPNDPVCVDCGKPIHWDEGGHNYVHDDPEAACWLHRELAEVSGATPCTIGEEGQ